MIYSPFSRPLKFELPNGKGIYLRPAGPAAPSGWGEPRYDENGKKIDPGTPGGPHPNVLLKDNGKIASNKYHQKAGCITWWGDYVDAEKPQEGRHVLSWNGPRCRYFRDAQFTYGANETHKEIYYKGAYAGIAPGPVLGACFRDEAYTDPEGVTTDVKWLYVIVYEAAEDRFYRRRFTGTMRVDGFTDQARADAARKYHEKDAPNGWVFMGGYARQGTAYSPETPWFFNQSGTQASCMRRVAFTFNNGAGAAGEITEDKYDRYQASVNVSSVSVQNLGNLGPMQYQEIFKKEHPDVYVSVDANGHSHQWQEDHLWITVVLQGEQYVLCDYRGDTLILGKMTYDTYLGQAQFFTKGIDPNEYYGDGDPPSEGNISNEGSRSGPLPYPPDYQPAQGDHYATTWLGDYTDIRLKVGPLSDPDELDIAVSFSDTGTSDEWAGHPKQDDNPYLFYHMIITRHIRGALDARDFIMGVVDQTVYTLYHPGSTPRRTEKFTDSFYASENMEGRQYKATSATTNTTALAVGFHWIEMEEWAEEIDNTLTRQTYIGSWVADNHYGDAQEPGSKAFFANPYSDIAKGWPTVEYLVSSPEAAAAEGNGVRTENGQWAFSMKVPDKAAEGRTVVLSDTNEHGQLPDVVGFGETFHPVGAA